MAVCRKVGVGEGCLRDEHGRGVGILTLAAGDKESAAVLLQCQVLGCVRGGGAVEVGGEEEHGGVTVVVVILIPLYE